MPWDFMSRHEAFYIEPQGEEMQTWKETVCLYASLSLPLAGIQ